MDDGLQTLDFGLQTLDVRHWTVDLGSCWLYIELLQMNSQYILCDEVLYSFEGLL